MRLGFPAILCFALVLAATAQAQEPAAQAPEEAPPSVEPPAIGWARMPSLADLEAAGATIGEIRIDPQNIFDLSDPQEDYLLYKVANALHIVTRSWVVRKTLLFKTGDRVSVRVIEETERLLRATLRVYGVRIRPIAYRDGVVDLEVLTRDQWTLDPSISFSRSGGVNSDRISIKEDNLLGTGTSLAYSRSSNIDRSSNTINLSHPHALGPYASASAQYSDTSDGKAWAVSVNRPFYALDTHHTWGAAIDKSERNEAVYVSGVNTGTYRHELSTASAFGGYSAGLIDGWTRRHTVGLEYQDNKYAEVPGQSPAGELPENLTLASPFYRFEVVEDRFRTGVNFDQIGKPEDYNLGLSLSAQLGRSLAFLGSSRQQWLYSTTVQKGWEVGNRGQLRTSAAFGGRYATGAEQQTTNGSVRYFGRQNNYFTFYGSIAGAYVKNPDIPNSIQLGGDEDLRGYPLRYQSGDKAVITRFEERVYTDWNPFRLIRIGAAAFYDGGRAWGGAIPNTANAGWLNDVGFGLRFQTDRSSRGNILHLDVAFPLNRDPAIDRVQLLVYTKVNL